MNSVLAFILFNLMLFGIPILFFFILIKMFESIDSIDPYANERQTDKENKHGTRQTCNTFKKTG